MTRCWEGGNENFKKPVKSVSAVGLLATIKNDFPKYKNSN